MNTSIFNVFATNVEFRDELMWVELSDGRQIGVPLSYFPRLSEATPEARTKYIISGGGIGIHWEELDEDNSVKGLLMGIGDRTSQTAEAA